MHYFVCKNVIKHIKYSKWKKKMPVCCVWHQFDDKKSYAWLQICCSSFIQWLPLDGNTLYCKGYKHCFRQEWNTGLWPRLYGMWYTLPTRQWKWRLFLQPLQLFLQKGKQLMRNNGFEAMQIISHLIDLSYHVDLPHKCCWCYEVLEQTFLAYDIQTYIYVFHFDSGLF